MFKAVGSISSQHLRAGFAPDETVTGKLKVSYSLFTTPTGDDSLAVYRAVRLPQAEDAARQYLHDNFQHTYWNRNDWDNKKNCNWAGSQNDGLWKREWVDVDPDLQSIEIWVDFAAGNGWGSINVGFTGHIHYIQWTCGARDYDHEISPRGHVNLTVHIDISSGTPNVHIDADIGIDDIGGIPAWAKNAVGALVSEQLVRKFNQIRPDLERRIADHIGNFKMNSSYAFLMSKSALEMFGIQRVIDDPSLYDLVLNDAVIGVGHLYLRELTDELNQEYIAQQLDAQQFPTRVDYIDAGNGLHFQNLDVLFVPQVLPGQVRILTAPHISIILDDAHFSFNIVGETNLFQSGHITIAGDLNLSFIHNYTAPKIEFRGLSITHLTIQEAPGFETFVKNKLNQNLPDKIAHDDELLKRVATLLNNAISHVINGTHRCPSFLPHEEFVRQIKMFSQFIGMCGYGCSA